MAVNAVLVAQVDPLGRAATAAAPPAVSGAKAPAPQLEEGHAATVAPVPLAGFGATAARADRAARAEAPVVLVVRAVAGAAAGMSRR